MSPMELTVRELEESIRCHQYQLKLLEWERMCFVGMLHKLKTGKMPSAPKRSRMLRIWIIIKYAARDIWREIRETK
jgi:hypothetical protein